MRANKILVWPTALWLIFGPVLGCMWIAAVNYANNLVYAILYLIASLAFISLFHTWRNLAALRVENIRIQPAFAGEDVRVEVYLRNSSKHTIYGLTFARYGEDVAGPFVPWDMAHPLRFLEFLRARRIVPLRVADARGVRVDAEDTCAVEVAFTSERRGLYRFDSLLLRSCYPLGLFWASVRLMVATEYYVYPKPEGTQAWPALTPGGESGAPSSLKAGDDFAGVRAYMPGESLRHVDWKAYARGRPLSVKQFTGSGGQELWLDAAEMGRLPLEARLSQLALWIVNAEKAEIPYALRLGRTTLPLGLGAVQERRALEALAVAGAVTS